MLESQYHMTFEEQQLGYTVKQLLKVLMIIKAGGHLALSIEEQIENEKQAEADMNAKLLIGTVRSWIKVQEEPSMRETARVALTFRMSSLASRKLPHMDVDDEDDGGQQDMAGSDDSRAST